LKIETTIKDYDINLESISGPLFEPKSDHEYRVLLEAVLSYMQERQLAPSEAAVGVLRVMGVGGSGEKLSGGYQGNNDTKEQNSPCMGKSKAKVEISQTANRLEIVTDGNLEKLQFLNASELISPVELDGPPSGKACKTPKLHPTGEIKINFDCSGESLVDSPESPGLFLKKTESEFQYQSSTSPDTFRRANRGRDPDNLSRGSCSRSNISRRISNKLYSPFKYSMIIKGQDRDSSMSRIDLNDSLLNDGKSHISHLKSNTVEFEAELVNGKKEGWGKWFHKCGKLRYEGFWKNDRPHGENVKIYYSNGNLEY
jgi:hypothetical protein